MRKIAIGSAAIAALLLVLVGCEEAGTAQGDPAGEITVIGYDDGGSWRNENALFYVGQEDAAISLTSQVADPQSMIDAVAANPEAIGFLEFERISVGRVDNADGVTLVTADGAELTVANVHSGEYPYVLELFLAWDTPQTDFAQDFVEFATSDTGQAILDDTYIPLESSSGAYTAASGLGSGFAMGGSSTVFPTAVDLIEAYEGADGQARTDVIDGDYDSVGSGAGAQGLIDGDYDLAGMSRDLKSDETDAGLDNALIGYTVWAFIVHPDAPVSSLTTAQLAGILTGEITEWATLAE